MDQAKMVTFESFARKAAAKIEARKKLKTKKLYIKDLDETIEIRGLTDQEFQDCAEYSEDDYTNDKYLVYYASKTLQQWAAQLMEQGVITDHLEVMDMFSRADRTELAKQVMTLTGLYDKPTVQEIEEVKN